MKKSNNSIITRIIIYFLLLTAFCSAIFVVFKLESDKEKMEDLELGLVSENRTLPMPNRIIYKNQNNEYIIITDTTSYEYVKIYSEFYNQITNIIKGKIYSEDEITQLQNNGSFVEFDYNKESKNFVFMLEENDVGIIWRTSDGGQVIKNSLNNTSKLIEKLDELTKNFSKYYSFDREQSYTSENKLETLPANIYDFEEVENNVYQKIIENDNYKEILENLNFKTDTKVPNKKDRQKVIITISQYEITNIKQNIGNIKYEFGDFLDEYTVNLLIVSNIVNTNCIYYNFTDLREHTTISDGNSSNIIYNANEYIENTNIQNTSSDDYAVSYYIENSKYYAIVNNKKVEILSLEKACDLADEEAKNTKYQYQPWKSDFYSRGINRTEAALGELISDLSDISKLYHWNENWKTTNYNNVSLMWKIRLFDENDPLTSLYIYIDATNGNIVGAGNSSD